MSVEAYVAILEAAIEDPTLKAILLGMANHAGPDGSHCYPSVKRISVYCSRGESTVRSKLKSARDLNMLKVVRKARAQRPTEYWMNIPMFKTMKSDVLIEMDDASAIYWGQDPSSPRRGDPSSQDTGPLQPGYGTPPTPGGEPSIEPSNNRKKMRRNPALPLCLLVYWKVTHRHVPTKYRDRVHRAVGDDFFDCLAWGRIVKWWGMSGYKITNYAGMLDVFDQRKRSDQPPQIGKFLDDLA